MNPNDVAAELETKPAVSIVYKKIKDGYRRITLPRVGLLPTPSYEPSPVFTHLLEDGGPTKRTSMVNI